MQDPVTLFFNVGFLIGAATSLSVVALFVQGVNYWKKKKDE